MLKRLKMIQDFWKKKMNGPPFINITSIYMIKKKKLEKLKLENKNLLTEKLQMIKFKKNQN